MSNRHRTRFERELIKLLCEELGSEWYGQRGAHSDGVDVLMFKSLESQPILFMGIRIEVKSKNKLFPVYLNKRERQQYQTYLQLYEDKNVETIYAFRKVGGQGEKWRFCRLTEFGITKKGNPSVRYEDTIGMTDFINQLDTINDD
jgi:Holliday junction resolvase|tara:strand:+ start:46 stop:480 length:435 start_codon:yes stop_codon:yes gene_type:complete